MRSAGACFFRAFHNPIDHVTGIKKRELLAHLAGDCDPFHILAIKRGKDLRVDLTHFIALLMTWKYS